MSRPRNSEREHNGKPPDTEESSILERFASQEDVDAIAGMLLGAVLGLAIGGLVLGAIGAIQWGDAALGAMAGGFFGALLGAVIGTKVGGPLMRAFEDALGPKLGAVARKALFVVGMVVLLLVGYFWGGHLLDTLTRAVGPGK